MRNIARILIVVFITAIFWEVSAAEVSAAGPEWENYEFSFRARAPKDAQSVQIWAGFRNYSRFEKYMVGIKGGLQDDLYLMRTGYMGADKFLAVRPLGFHPVPGEWYSLKVQVCRDRIRIFVNDGDMPHIDIVDANADLAPSGPVTLGGGWLDTEYDGLVRTPLEENALDGVSRQEWREMLSLSQKEEMRFSMRASYKPVVVDNLAASRSEISLDGDWLFAPEYEVSDVRQAVETNADDSGWHVMSVPSFWTPIRIWLHGETMSAANGQEHKGVSDTYYQKETDRCENYTFDYRRTDAAWYRHKIILPDNAFGKRMSLHFDAVSKTAEVYVNGHLAGTHIGMFGEFDVDVTDLLVPGENVVAVKVVRNLGKEVSDIEDFYSSVRKELEENVSDDGTRKEELTDVPHGFYGDNPAGIWQNVKLVVTDAVKIEDVFIKPSLDGASFELTLDNAGKKNRMLNVNLSIVDKSDGTILYAGKVCSKQKISASGNIVRDFEIGGLSPKLWEPSSPNLYDFIFTVCDGSSEVDRMTVTSGFRTFESRDGFLYLNGRRYWLRGGNHIPFAICPNDSLLADRFMGLMKQGNVNATRTHTSPWNELWINAADKNGIIVSFEGTWSWLMIHSTPIPSQSVLSLWRDEWLQVMKKYRNHPSVCIWTVNNEMKFYDLDENKDRAARKFTIISDVVKRMRTLDPTRPISFDSNYMRRSGVRRFGEEFISTVDDGDIDDNHGYYNWYDFSLFRFFNGEFYRNFGTPGRPLISQEMSTGYPNAETGHPTRSYQLIHQNPFSLIGYKAYDWEDPDAFLSVQSFITGELAEALRRTGDDVSGIMHFSYMTWFRQHYDAEKIEPYPTYYAMQRALRPVLVSAEIWGRNLFAGDRLSTRIYVVNDSEDARALSPMTLEWTFEDKAGNVFGKGSCDFPEVAYCERKYVEPEIVIPSVLPEDKTEAVFRVRLVENGNMVSENEYSLLLASRKWIGSRRPGRIVLMDHNGFGNVLDALGVQYDTFSEIEDCRLTDILVISGMNACDSLMASKIRDWQSRGGRLIFLGGIDAVSSIYPEYLTGSFIPTEGDIVVMEREENPVFSGIGPLELRYFNNGRREIPLACNRAIKAVRTPEVTELASHMKIHAYIDDGTPEDRLKRIESMRGLTLMKISDGKGTAIVSTMCLEKAVSDPIAARLLMNLLNFNE